ncbi:hypothetical protein [Halomicrobium salinisoli]|uniref:hypothetical protein n=1 Tax=Halomicrobium salinisoli TaxID=2878391 RepID=UPI001CEFE925|nr:hypothetical protein [Halomicrobium salinisoli]
MDRLSSCYFCGAALDASLSEYPIVPAELLPDDDQQQTVVLCPTCQRKLGQVVETVVGAVDGQPDADDDAGSTVDSGRQRTDAGGAVEGDGDAENVGWTSAEDAVEQGSTSPRSTPSREDAAGARSSEPSVANAPEDAVEQDSTTPRSASSREDANRGGNGSYEGLLGGVGSDEVKDGRGRDGARSEPPERGRNGRSDDGRAGDDRSAAPRRPQNGSAGADDGNADASTGQRAGGRSGSTADEGNYGDGRSAADVASDRSEAAEADEGTGDPTDGEPSLTRLEYNKVMRLLQNREFPVDRAEIKAVATNAYEISDDEFERIIDAAVEHDLIDERSGQLVQSD